MTGGRSEEEPDGPHPYFMAIEEVFLDLRGSPLQLTSADWRLAETWFRQGIPLDLVERTVRAAFARRQAKEDQAKKQKVWSLRYCKRAVESAWRRQQELAASGAPDPAETLDLEARLARLAAALPAALVGRVAIARRIESLEGDAEGVEAALATIDREVVGDAGRHLTQQQNTEVERELELAREALAQRLPAAELERSTEQLREQIVRRHLELPILSLFAPEALEQGDG
ncbi:MAG: hypothetical protein AAF657_05120 [Acidobacteriota bacterium]